MEYGGIDPTVRIGKCLNTLLEFDRLSLRSGLQAHSRDPIWPERVRKMKPGRYLWHLCRFGPGPFHRTFWLTVGISGRPPGGMGQSHLVLLLEPDLLGHLTRRADRSPSRERNLSPEKCRR